LKNYTRNEWRRWKNTLETSGEDVPEVIEFGTTTTINTTIRDIKKLKNGSFERN
jgi:hypothetical protein